MSVSGRVGSLIAVEGECSIDVKIVSLRARPRCVGEVALPAGDDSARAVPPRERNTVCPKLKDWLRSWTGGPSFTVGEDVNADMDLSPPSSNEEDTCSSVSEISIAESRRGGRDPAGIVGRSSSENSKMLPTLGGDTGIIMDATPGVGESVSFGGGLGADVGGQKTCWTVGRACVERWCMRLKRADSSISLALDCSGLITR